MPSCTQRQELQQACTQILDRIRALSGESIQALQTNNGERLRELDRELELAIGEKERTFGALWQHTAEHGC
jgi:hypothetical protein